MVLSAGYGIYTGRGMVRSSRERFGGFPWAFFVVRAVFVRVCACV